MTLLTPLDFWRAGMGVWLTALQWQAEFGQRLFAAARADATQPEPAAPLRSLPRRAGRG